jgi:hypothetical protein
MDKKQLSPEPMQRMGIFRVSSIPNRWVVMGGVHIKDHHLTLADGVSAVEREIIMVGATDHEQCDI